MPTNLPAEAKSKWNRVSMTRNPREKLQLLQEFLSLVPKHKGTEKLRAQVKTKMASLRREIQESKQRKLGRRGGTKHSVQKEGSAQIVILGVTNVGRSSLLSRITNAKVEVSNYPFTTREPTPGMLLFEGYQFQLVEAPALVQGAAEGKAQGQLALRLARNADGLILMINLAESPLKQYFTMRSELENAHILAKKPDLRVELERKHVGFGLRVIVVGKLVDCTLKDVETLLKSYRISDAVARIYGNVSLDNVEDSVFESSVFRPTIVVANKFDVQNAKEGFRRLVSAIGGDLRVVPVSCKTGFGLNKLGAELSKMLEVIQVFTKEPGSRKPSQKPFTLKKESTIADLAKQIHSDFYNRFSYAKVWSKRLPFSPQKVGLSFVLGNKDVVEIHLR